MTIEEIQNRCLKDVGSSLVAKLIKCMSYHVEDMHCFRRNTMEYTLCYTMEGEFFAMSLFTGHDITLRSIYLDPEFGSQSQIIYDSGRLH